MSRLGIAGLIQSKPMDEKDRRQKSRIMYADGADKLHLHLINPPKIGKSRDDFMLLLKDHIDKWDLEESEKA